MRRCLSGYPSRSYFAHLSVKKSSGALYGFRGQPSAQSKRYHTTEYKLILYAIPLGLKSETSKKGNETRIKRNFIER